MNCFNSYSIYIYVVLVVKRPGEDGAMGEFKRPKVEVSIMFTFQVMQVLYCYYYCTCAV